MDASKKKRAARERRHYRVRARIEGTAERPRLNVFRSLDNIYAQVIDDKAGHTLVSASTLDKDLRSGKTGNTDAAKAVGKLIAERAQAAGVTGVAFDRSGFRYHGRVKALADAAREAGLQF